MVYIAAPYHADTPEEMERNRQAAFEACEYAHSLGDMTGSKIIPVTSIGQFPYLDDSKPEERAQTLRMGIALMSRCDELWVAGDHVSEGMRGEIRAALRLGMPVMSVMYMDAAKVQAAAAGMKPMLDEKKCYTNSDRRDYTGQLLIMKPSALAPWALEPENQLWVASHGFGTSPTASGRAVYCENLFDGEKARFDRADFFGVANVNRLPDWAQERFAEYQRQQNEESEDLEP